MSLVWQHLMTNEMGFLCCGRIASKVAKYERGGEKDGRVFIQTGHHGKVTKFFLIKRRTYKGSHMPHTSERTCTQQEKQTTAKNRETDHCINKYTSVHKSISTRELLHMHGIQCPVTCAEVKLTTAQEKQAQKFTCGCKHGFVQSCGAIET